MTTMGEATPLFASRGVFFLPERERALAERGVGHAAHLIKDAVIGRQDAPYEGYYDPYQDACHAVRNRISIVCGRLTVPLRTLAIGASWALVALTFVEPPSWCRDASALFADGSGQDPGDDRDGYGDCRRLFETYGTAADGAEHQEFYPSAGTLWLTLRQSRQVERAGAVLVALHLACAFADDGFVLRLFFYPTMKGRLHAVQCGALAGLVAGALAERTAWNPVLRLLLLGTYLRKFHRELATFLTVVPKMMPGLIMVALVIVFYAWFGVAVFYDSPQGRTAFPNLAEGMWTLWICVTTANYPDVMMPGYNENRVVALFFISFMVLSFFYLMNLVLALTVNAYDESIAARQSSRAALSKRLLAEAFQLLDHDSDGAIGRDSILHVMTILNQDVPEIRGLTDDEISIMYAFLDKDGSDNINQEEFQEFSSVLLLRLSKTSDYAPWVETHLPSLFRSNSYQCLSKFIKSKSFEYAVDIVLVLNALIAAGQDYPILVGQDVSTDPHFEDGYIDTPWEAAESLFTLLYVIEATLKIIVNGWKSYSEQPRNAFDLFITVTAVLASAYVYYPNEYNNSSLIGLVVMARVLRLSRLLFTVESFRMLGEISLDIIPAATGVFVVLLFITYSFALVGMALFGGVISRDPNNIHYQSLMEAGDFVDSNYWANNFNDMFSGMNVLFNMLVVNNWTTQSSGLECATGSKWLVRLYFLAFNLLGVIGISNVITSFVINAFFQQLVTINEGTTDMLVDGEAVITGKKAVFDASVITGTRTGLRMSEYFARIQPKYMDVELDERKELRRLFSSSSTGGERTP